MSCLKQCCVAVLFYTAVLVSGDLWPMQRHNPKMCIIMLCKILHTPALEKPIWGPQRLGCKYGVFMESPCHEVWKFCNFTMYVQYSIIIKFSRMPFRINNAENLVGQWENQTRFESFKRFNLRSESMILVRVLSVFFLPSLMYPPVYLLSQLQIIRRKLSIYNLWLSVW